MPFVGGLHLSSRARAYLENLRPSRARNGRLPRTLRHPEVEERIDQLIRTAGEAAANRLRDDARAIAAELDLEAEAARLDALIGALLDTRRSRLDSPVARGRGRPEVLPGEFKVDENRAGLTVFVAPELVAGTLEEGFALYRSLESSFERAAYVMFLVNEVHPFADGNGRIARVMMNAELVAGGEERIVIPTVYRGNYLAALRALSRTGRAEPLVSVLDFAQRWTVAVDWSSLEWARRELEGCNAFLDSDEAEAMGRRLRMPG